LGLPFDRHDKEEMVEWVSGWEKWGEPSVKGKIRLKVRCSVKGCENPATRQLNRKSYCENHANQLRWSCPCIEGLDISSNSWRRLWFYCTLPHNLWAAVRSSPCSPQYSSGPYANSVRPGTSVWSSALPAEH